jgi:hypothetical protein
METPAQNRQQTEAEHRKAAKPEDTENHKFVAADENRQKHIKEVGPHEHAWAFYGMGADGGRYEVCEICGTRRVANIPLISALHKDWIEGTGKFQPEKELEAQAKNRSAKADADDDDDAKAKGKAGQPAAHKA